MKFLFMNVLKSLHSYCEIVGRICCYGAVFHPSSWDLLNMHDNIGFFEIAALLRLKSIVYVTKLNICCQVAK